MSPSVVLHFFVLGTLATVRASDQSGEVMVPCRPDVRLGGILAVPFDVLLDGSGQVEDVPLGGAQVGRTVRPQVRAGLPQASPKHS